MHIALHCMPRLHLFAVYHISVHAACMSCVLCCVAGHACICRRAKWQKELIQGWAWEQQWPKAGRQGSRTSRRRWPWRKPGGADGEAVQGCNANALDLEVSHSREAGGEAVRRTQENESSSA
eukprot:1161954-Pelagomonas_calceolata.AAC.10